MATIYQQTIEPVDIRRFKACFENSIGTMNPVPSCQYITTMTGLTVTSIKKLAKQLKLIPCDLYKKERKNVCVKHIIG